MRGSETAETRGSDKIDPLLQRICRASHRSGSQELSKEGRVTRPYLCCDFTLNRGLGFGLWGAGERNLCDPKTLTTGHTGESCSASW